jgi:gamma-glutamyltranspeptidase/glutathione hydrolase
MGMAPVTREGASELTRVPLGSRVGVFTLSLIALLPFLQSGCSGNVVLEASSGQRSGAVSSESKVCSEIGIDLLKRGVRYALPGFKFNFLTTPQQGNAADALVGTSLCVGVTGRTFPPDR